MRNKHFQIGIMYLIVLFGVLQSVSATNMTIDDLINSFNYSYSNGSIEIGTFQDSMKDQNSNGMNDTLTINLTAGTLTDGVYTFIVNLEDNGELRVNSTLKSVSASDPSAQVNFPTDLLEASKFNYTLEILNANDELVFRTNKQQTSSYGSYERGLNLLSLSDQNLNNNSLQINLQVNSTKNFTANVTITLAYNSSSISSTEEKTLISGTNSYTIQFDNETLKSTHYASNFTIDSIIIGDKAFDTNQNTSIHNFEDFAKTSYIRGATDQKIDTNNNELADVLELNFTIISKSATTYTLTYDLYDEFGNFITNLSKTQSLDTGTQTISTYINGTDIYKTKTNGPYVVSFASLSDTSSTVDVLFDAHTTNETFYTDYERPPLPDLNLTLGISFNATTATTNVSVLLQNLGDAPAFNVFLDIFDNTTYQNNRSIAYMEPGETIYYNFTISNASNATLYTLIADFDNLVDEQNESNNIAQGIYTPSQAPVVVSLAITSIEEMHSNGTLSLFEFIIENNGTSTVYNISWQFDTGDNAVINSTQNISSLSSGETAFVYLAYNYSAQGSYTIKANATDYAVVSNTYLLSSSNTDIEVTDLNATNPQHNDAFISFSIRNQLDSTLTPINWSLTTGESVITSNSPISLSGNETIFVLIGHQYSQRGDYSITANGSSASSYSLQTIGFSLEDLEVQEFSLLNQSAGNTLFFLDIQNTLNEQLNAVNWSIDTKNSQIINATSPITLNASEHIFALIGYNFTSSGTFEVNATAMNGTFSDSQLLAVIVP